MSALYTASLWDSKVYNLNSGFLMSQRQIFESFEPVRKMYSSWGLKSIEKTSSEWASTLATDLFEVISKLSDEETTARSACFPKLHQKFLAFCSGF